MTSEPTDGFSEPTPPSPQGYPIHFEVQRPEHQSRLTNFPLTIGTIIRAILAIPHFIILYFLQIVAGIVYFIATFAILFTGRYPRGMYDFYASYLRWSYRVSCYVSHLYDDYPPFAFGATDYPLRLEADYPERSSRLLNFPFLWFVIKGVLLIPHYIAIFFLTIAWLVILFISLFAILFTGSFPAGMHGFGVGVLRWAARITAYLYGLTDRYPPFSMSS